MKSTLRVSSLVLLSLSSFFAARAHEPFVVVTDQAQIAESQQGMLLWQEGTTKILRTESAIESDFNDLYVVRTPFNVTTEELGNFARVLYHKNGLAVVRSGVGNVEALSSTLHQAGMPCGSIQQIDGSALALSTNATATPKIPVESVDAKVATLLSQTSEDEYKKTVTAMSSIKTRYHSSATNTAVVDLLKKSYTQFAGMRSDVSVESYSHNTATPQPSVVVRIQGKVSPEEIVVLGSHIDSVNWSDGTSQMAPGVDDNASGTATNLEVFRIFMANNIVPARTIEFHGYAAEEIGLVGSNNMAKRYKADNKNVVSMLQNDMNLYKRQNDALKVWFISNNTDDGLNNLLGKIVDNYLKVPWEKKSLFGGDSDHTSWRRQGYSTAFPFENPSGYNNEIHTRDDNFDTSRAFDQALLYTKLSLAYAAHFAGIVE